MGRGLIPRRSRRTFPSLPYEWLYYAVLSHVSMCYSPPEGRLPTCYSPVRRFQARRPIRSTCMLETRRQRSFWARIELSVINTLATRTRAIILWLFFPAISRTGLFLVFYRSYFELTEAPLLLSSFPSLMLLKNFSLPPFGQLNQASIFRFALSTAFGFFFSSLKAHPCDS